MSRHGNAGNPPKYGPKAAKPAAPGGSVSTAAPTSALPSALAGVLPPGAAAVLASVSPVLVGKICVWCFVWWLCIRIEFGSIFLVLSAIIGIFRNLSSSDSKKPGQLSAYSVFNEGATRIAGSMDAEAIDNQIRHKQSTSKGLNLDLGSSGQEKEHYARKSKAANQPCVCGSGRKYKVCCSPLTVSEKQLDKEWQEFEEEWTAR